MERTNGLTQPKYDDANHGAASKKHWINDLLGFGADANFGGALYIDKEDNKLKYNAGRELSNLGDRNPCEIDMCKENPSWCALCNEKDHAWNKITNTKAFLVPGVGLQSWKGRMG